MVIVRARWSRLCFLKPFVFDVDQPTLEKFGFYQTSEWGAFGRKSTSEMLEQNNEAKDLL